jgi:2,5-furandicarboxylate decarboxylase 1
MDMNERTDVSKETFRGFLDRLRAAGELVDIRQPVDIRHVATLVDQAETALHFHDVIGYGMPIVSGLIRTRERAIMSMGCATYGEIEEKLQRGIDHPGTWRPRPTSR